MWVKPRILNEDFAKDLIIRNWIILLNNDSESLSHQANDDFYEHWKEPCITLLRSQPHESTILFHNSPVPTLFYPLPLIPKLLEFPGALPWALKLPFF